MGEDNLIIIFLGDNIGPVIGFVLTVATAFCVYRLILDKIAKAAYNKKNKERNQ